MSSSRRDTLRFPLPMTLRKAKFNVVVELLMDERRSRQDFGTLSLLWSRVPLSASPFLKLFPPGLCSMHLSVLERANIVSSFLPTRDVLFFLLLSEIDPHAYYYNCSTLLIAHSHTSPGPHTI